MRPGFVNPVVKFDADGIPHVMVEGKELAVTGVTMTWKVNEVCKLAIESFAYDEAGNLTAGFRKVDMGGSRIPPAQDNGGNADPGCGHFGS